MSLLEKIINDSEVFIRMKDSDPYKFEGMTIEILNSYFDDVYKFPELNGIINRIIPYYENIIYPDPDHDKEQFLQLLKDFDYLASKKRIDLLVLLYYSKSRQFYINQFNNTMNIDYNEINLDKYRRKVYAGHFQVPAIALGLLNVLKFKKYYFDKFHFLDACKYGQLEIAEHIYELLDIDIHDRNEQAFLYACRSGNLELVKWLWNIGLKLEMRGLGRINIHVHHCLAFIYACESGNLELVQWLWNIGVESNNIIDIHAQHEGAFQRACSSGNLDLVKFIWNIGVESNNIIDIHSLAEMAFRFACYSGNLLLVQWLWDIGLDPRFNNGRIINIHDLRHSMTNNNESGFIYACLSENIELIKWLWNIGLNPEFNNGKIIDLSKYPSHPSRYSPKIKEFLKTLN